MDVVDRIEEYIKAGIIFQDNRGDWIGIAADGVEVQIGNDYRDMSRYIAAHPERSDW